MNNDTLWVQTGWEYGSLGVTGTQRGIYQLLIMSTNIVLSEMTFSLMCVSSKISKVKVKV